jgi:hypothetical protein
MTEDDTFDALRKPLTKDEIVFGRNRWVYCSQHLNPHSTGRCSVSIQDKILLDACDIVTAESECRHKGFKLYSDIKK